MVHRKVPSGDADKNNQFLIRRPSLISSERERDTLFMRSHYSEHHEEVFKIIFARCPAVLNDAGNLLNCRYRQRGYGSQDLATTAGRVTIVAYLGMKAIGTLTVQLDTGERLAADDCFAETLHSFRAKGDRICEFTKLATIPGLPVRGVLASLFHVGFIYVHQLNCVTHVAIEVNPRHVDFYTRVLGFQIHGTPQVNPRVKATSILLIAKFDDIGRRLHAHDSEGAASEGLHNFFLHAFSNAEEEGIRQRIRGVLNRMDGAG